MMTWNQETTSPVISPGPSLETKPRCFSDRRPTPTSSDREAQNLIHIDRLTIPPVAHAAEAAEAAVVRVSLAALLAGHVIQDGEIVQMILKPSRWFIILNSLFFNGMVIAFFALLHVVGWHLFEPRSTLQLIVLLIAARMMWSALQWMGRYYILTNHRLIRLSGVFDVQIMSIPLRKVSGIRLYQTVSERLLNKGSLEVTAPGYSSMLWQTFSRPKHIYECVRAAVLRSQSNGNCG
jgi:hypothetical protein